MKSASISAVLLLLATLPAHGQQAATTVNVQFYALPPKEVYVTLNKSEQDGQQRLPLTARQSSWSADLPWNVQAKLEIRRGKIEASFPDPASGAYIPIRLTRLLSSADVQLRKTAAPNCLEANLRIIERSAQSDEHRFKAYLLARDLFYLAAPDPCGSVQKDRVIKAWFDRSYDLATSVDYVDLDPDAIDAARATLGEAYVKNRIDQVRGYEVQLLQDRKLIAIRKGNLGGAASLQELIAKMTSDEAIAKAVQTHQGLTPKQIEKDDLYIRSLAATAGVKG